MADVFLDIVADILLHLWVWLRRRRKAAKSE
jgi:hypothetical protein